MHRCEPCNFLICPTKRCFFKKKTVPPCPKYSMLCPDSHFHSKPHSANLPFIQWEQRSRDTRMDNHASCCQQMVWLLSKVHWRFKNSAIQLGTATWTTRQTTLHLQPLDMILGLLGDKLDALQDVCDIIDPSLLHLQHLCSPVEIYNTIRRLAQ